MEFGRVPENELSNIDFTLPKEPDFNKAVLKGKRQMTLKFILGVPNGAEQNGWVRYTRPNKRKGSCLFF